VLAHFVREGVECLLLACFFGAWLFLVTRRRALWSRYLAAEMRFWQKLGLSWPRLTDLSRRFFEGRPFTYILCFLALGFSALTVLNVGMYFHWRRIFHMHVPI
jgi:hypothetical protein